LAKELELYKSKSNIEVDKKLSALESKTKTEAKTLRTENQHLKEIIAFKDAKIAENQQEIERLKIVLRMDAAHSKKIVTYQNPSILEHKLDEIARTGKIEYRIYLTAEDNPLIYIEKPQSLGKILSMTPASLTNGLCLQAKMLEQGAGSGDISEELKIKFEEITKERAKLEGLMNKILAYEKSLQDNYEGLVGSVPRKGAKKQVVKVKEDWKSNEKVGLSQSPIHSAKSSTIKGQEDSAKKQRPEDVDQEQVNTFIEEGNLLKATEILKESNYELPNENLENAIHKLRLACKVKDKQLEKLKKELKNVKVVKKCMELVEDDVNEILNDYEAVKDKYQIESEEDEEFNRVVPQRIKEEDNKEISYEKIGVESKKSNVRIKELEEELKKTKELIAKKDEENIRISNELEECKTTMKENRDEIDELSESMKNVEELEDEKTKISKQLEESNKKLKKQEKEKEQLTNELETIKKAMEDLEGARKELLNQIEEGKKALKQKDEKIKELDRAAYIKTPVQSKVQKSDTDSPWSYIDTFKANLMKKPSGQHTSASLKTECDKGRELIKALMESKAPSQEETSKVLYDQTVLLQKLSEELESIGLMIDDLSGEHAMAISKLEQILEQKSSVIAPRPLKQKNLYEYFVNEIQAARKINFLLNGISLATINQDTMQKYQLNSEDTRTPANELYKEFFVEERVYPMTVESLLDRVRMKNHRFKNLFKLYEKLLAINDSLMASKYNTSPPLKKFSSARKESPGENKDYVIKELLAEMQGLKEAVASKRPVQSMQDENLWKDKVEILEDKIQLGNRKLKDCESELEKKMSVIADKDREIGRLNTNNEKLLAELSQLKTSFTNRGSSFERRYESSPSTYQPRTDSFETKFKDVTVKLNEKMLENQDLKSINAQLLNELNTYKEQMVYKNSGSPKVIS
jgi:hypothetical protein